MVKKTHRSHILLPVEQVILLLIIQLCSLWGLGSLFAQFFSFRKERNQYGFLGLLSIGCLSLFVHFFAPLFPFFSGFIAFVGLLVFFKRVFRKEIFSFLCILLPLLHPLLVSVPTYDTGLYHASAIIWNQQEPIAIGLANLSSRLGFNSIWMLVSAGSSFVWNPLVSAFLVNITLFIFFSFFVLSTVFRARYFSKNVLFLVFVYVLFVGNQFFNPSFLGGPSNDFPAQVFSLLSIYLLFEWLEKKEVKTFELSFAYALFSTLIKLTSLPLLIILGLVAWYSGRKLTFSLKSVLIGSLVLLWCLRSFLLSGCFVLLSSACVDSVSWSAKEEIMSTMDWVKSWPRHRGKSPEEVLGNTRWILEYWIPFHKTEVRILLPSVLFILTIVRIFFLLLKRRKIPKKMLFVLSIFSAILVFWFVTAPDLRFAEMYWIALGVYCLLLFIPAQFTPRAEGLVKLLILLFLSFVLIRNLRRLLQNSELFNDAWPRLPSQTMVDSWVGSNGKEFFSVSNGDDRCYAISLWCTPEKNQKLKVTTSFWYTIISKR